MKRYCIFGMAMAMTLGCAAIVPQIEKKGVSSECQKWVDSVYQTLSERDRVAQLIFPKFNPKTGEEGLERLKMLVGENHVGGLLFSEGSLENYVEMTNYAQSISNVPLLMVFDGEWGLSMRIPETQRYPKNMALGAMNDTSLMRAYGEEMARECRLTGIHVNFAPVMDVNSNPQNPIIGDRSYGSDPQKVSELGIAYSRGLEAGGTQAVAKHFPGHGDTYTDSHKTLPTVNLSKEEIDNVHLYPFQKYIDAELSGVMIAHISVPVYDPSGMPASLSPVMTTDLLKNSMGFEGLVYSDALGMHGADVPEDQNNALLALQAGCDVLEASRNPIRDLDVIYEAVMKGEISMNLVEKACKRILTYKYLLGLPEEGPIVMEGLVEKLNSPEAIALNRELSNAVVTVLSNNDELLPIGNLDKNKIAVVSLGAPVKNQFSDMAALYTSVSQWDKVDETTAPEILKNDIVIAAVFKADSAEVAQAQQISGAKHLVLVFLTNPYKLEAFKPAIAEAEAVVLTYDDSPMLREAAAQALFGGIDVNGVMPVTVDGIANRGDGMKLKKSRLGFSSPLNEGLNPSLTYKLDSIVEHALEMGAFPGCQLLIAKSGNVIHNKSYGLLTAGGDAVTDSVVYDLASVSKALGTLPGVMKVFDEGLIELKAPASKYIPQLRGTPKEKFTIEDLLYHETGMPAALYMFSVMLDPENPGELRKDIVSFEQNEEFPIAAADGIYVGQAAVDTIMRRIYDIPLKKDKNYLYSCLNFILLKNIEENVTGIPHNVFVHDSIFAPLGAYTTTYRPLELHERRLIAPTEMDSVLRHQLVHGYVHDETANFQGGVSGNAGLFSNAMDLAKICQMWLNGGVYGDKRILSEETVKLFTQSKTPNSRRGLGFDKPDTVNPNDSPTCDEADPSVFGHTGFTGTIFWVDPVNELIYVFLCNRVNPSRITPNFARSNARPALFREVYRSL
ncbi:MAG: serine hydrolase [Muribaculaceae bacterium]|nr:serine hydrolase [Muribaculaceae bacterium]